MFRISNKINLPASAICIEDNKTFVALQDPAGRISVQVLHPTGNEVAKIASFSGSKCFLLNSANGKMFIGIDNKLLLRDNGGCWKIVLRTIHPSNFFWHMAVTSEGTIFVQEYGEPPTGIYRSTDGRHWQLIITSSQLDRQARHFHSIAYDQFRNILIATLGDRNLLKIAISSDDGKNWAPLYKGAWQVLPIEVMKDQIVFGMDVGFAGGGLMVYFPNEDRFEISHLKWRKPQVNSMQMVSLRYLNNRNWVAALGAPQAIIASSNLREWGILFLEGFDKRFCFSMDFAEGAESVTFVTGKSLFSIQKRDIAKYINSCEHPIFEHRALFEKLTGSGYRFRFGRIRMSDIMYKCLTKLRPRRKDYR